MAKQYRALTRLMSSQATFEPVSAKTQPVSGHTTCQIPDIENSCSRDSSRKTPPRWEAPDFPHDLPERDRVALTREVYGRLIAKLDIAPAKGAPLHFRVAARVFPGLIISSHSRSPVILKRTREFLADGNDDVVLAVSRTPGNLVSHVGRELVTGVGDTILFSSADVTVINAVSTQQALSIALRRRLLASMVPGLEDRFLRPVPSDSEVLRLLTSYVGVIEDQQKLTTAELRQLVVSHVYDLVALALGASRDAAEIRRHPNRCR